ncbi:alpha/beta hydrolase [Bryobacter aggregatus]|uniref:alpha/beta hydrolase n=1 Tax=Bryobacter aggregatus TaxID=360054 RepID=UPI0009B599D8|nr:alpha/beta hydrolase [Bryobacter aggregatus]
MKQLDLSAQELIDQLAKYGAPPIETLSVGEARNVPLLDYAARDLVAAHLTARMATVANPMPQQVESVRHRRIPVKDGSILLRIYKPVGPGPHPILVYFHGGGWVIANLDTYDSSARALCNAAECIVISVAYRQAPEHKFPTAIEDAYAATEWAMANADSLNGNAAQVAVGGESAGGNLAAVVCQMARAQGTTQPVHQLLIYPVTDLAFFTPSIHEYAHAKPLNAAMLTWFSSHYLKSAEEAAHGYASPLRATTLANLPPATIITAEHDPLRDDGRLYAEALRDEGVRVTYRNYHGVMHEFFGMIGLLDQSADAVNLAAMELGKSFGRNVPESLMAVDEHFWRA